MIFLYLEFTKNPPRERPPAKAAPLQAVAPTKGQASRDETEPVEAADNIPPALTENSVKPPAVVVPAAPVTEEPAAHPQPPLREEAELVLTGLDANRDAASARDKALLDRAIETGKWDDYRNLLGKSIDAGLSKLAKGNGSNRYDAEWKEAVWYQAFLRWQVLGRLSEPVIAAQVTDRYTGKLLAWLCNDSKAMEEFLLTIKPEDDAAQVLKFLMEVWPNSTEESMTKYFPLALACSVVFDHEVAIPNPVKGTYGSAAAIEPMKRYLWFVDKNEKGKLTAPVHHSSARDLVWVVCAPVSDSELDWSLDKLHMTRQHWGNAYGMIEYLMERAVKGLNPYKEYTFAEILKEGGICGDQSYFCANTARAQGIPAMIFGGETDLGPHAWVGIKVANDEWTTGVGRVGGVSKGQTENPQTGATISEQEVQLWADRAHQSPLTSLAVARHLWLASYFTATGKDDGYAECVKLANQLGLSFTETWAELYALLKKQTTLSGEPAVPSNLENWKAFAISMRREFKGNPRMAQLAANAEMEYIFPYADTGDAQRNLLRERRRIDRDASEQTDLIAESLKREADLVLKRGEPDAKQQISRLYDAALRKYGGSITGFKMMAGNYFSYIKDDPELAHKAARDIELAFKRVVETGTKDWFRANTEMSIHKMICSYYRASGDEDRAVMLEKRIEVLLKRAERGAL